MDWKEFLAVYRVPLVIIAIITGALLLSRLLRWIVSRSFRRIESEDKSSATALNFLKNTITALILFVSTIAVIYTIPALRTLAAGLTAGAGIFAAIAAFASQAALSNLIGGIFIVIFRPFRVNDRVSIGNQYEGFIEDITLRHTVIRHWDNKRIVIPNSIISSETVTNTDLTEEMTYRFMEVPLSYDSDWQHAVELIQAEVQRHPEYVDPRTPEEIAEGAPPVLVRVLRYTDAGAVLRVYLWGDAGKTFALSCDLRLSLQRLFAQAGIKMGVPHWMRYGEGELPIEVGAVSS